MKNCNYHFYDKGLIHLVHEAGTEIYPSIGGWSLSDPFPAMAASATARERFISKCIDLIVEYDFDGIDLDWEYPGYKDHSGTPEDTVNFNLLLGELRAKLDEHGSQTGRFYGLTAALPCGTSNIANIDIATAASYLTELNLMTYDFFGAWSPTTGTNAPLFSQEWGDEDVAKFSVDGCVRSWIEGGGSPSAINIGLPFYGRSFLNAKDLNQPHGGTDKNNWGIDDGSPQYFNIVEKLPQMVSVRHEMTKTQFAYFDTSQGGLVSFDDEQAICDKADYCIQNSLNGFIIWEISGDLMDDLSTPLLDAVHMKLNNPSLDCGSFGDGAVPIDATASNEEGSYQVVPHPPSFQTIPRPGSYQTLLEPTSPRPSRYPTLRPTSLPTKSPTTSSPTEALYCEEGITGVKPFHACTAYYYCVYGSPHYPIIKCPMGTLFDEISFLCLPKNSVTCSITAEPTVSTSKPTRLPTKHPTREPTNMPSPAPTQRAVLAEVPDLSLCTSCPDGFDGLLPTTDCSAYCFCINGIHHGPIVSCPEGSFFSKEKHQCLPPEQVMCNGSALPSGNMRHNYCGSSLSEVVANCGTESKITCDQGDPPCAAGLVCFTDFDCAVVINNDQTFSTSTNHIPNDPLFTLGNTQEDEENKQDHVPDVLESSLGIPSDSLNETPNSPVPVYITIQIKFGDNPADIGWSVMSNDGSVEVVRPPGAYQHYEPYSTVNEIVTTQGLDPNNLKFLITMRSESGKGLSDGDGYYQIFAGSAYNGDLVAEGKDFSFIEDRLLEIGKDGIVLLHEGSRPTSSPMFASTSAGFLTIDKPGEDSLSAPQEFYDSDADGVSPAQTKANDEHFGPESNRQAGKNERFTSSPIFISILVTVFGILFSGIGLLARGSRKRNLDSYCGSVNYSRESHDDCSNDNWWDTASVEDESGSSNSSSLSLSSGADWFSVPVPVNNQEKSVVTDKGQSSFPDQDSSNLLEMACDYYRTNSQSNEKKDDGHFDDMDGDDHSDGVEDDVISADSDFERLESADDSRDGTAEDINSLLNRIEDESHVKCGVFT